MDDDAVKQAEQASEPELSDKADTELETLSKPEQVPENQEEEVLETAVETETQDEESTVSVIKTDEPASLEIQETDTKEPAHVDSKPISPEEETETPIAVPHVVEASEEQIVEQITVQSESIPADGVKSDELVQTPETQTDQTLEPEITLQDSDSKPLTITETKDVQAEKSVSTDTEKETEAISIADTTVLAPEVSGIEPQEPEIVKETTQSKLTVSESETEAVQDENLIAIASVDQQTPSMDDDAVKQAEQASEPELSDKADTELETLSKPEQVPENQEEEVLETAVETETQDEESTVSVIKTDEPASLEIQETDTKEPAHVDSKPISPEEETETPIAVPHVVEASEEQIVEQITVQFESIPADGVKSDELVQTPETQTDQTLEPEITLQDSDSKPLTITETKDVQAEKSVSTDTEKETEAISIADTTVLVIKTDEPASLEIQETDTKEPAHVDSKPISPEEETETPIAVPHVVEASEEQIVEQIKVQSESIPADGVKSDELKPKS
ncbi:zinc metalloprotease ZmpB-like [Cloeon dipterum]|uniref:zinc metalloprotease ZmpB-like n=1 Tax=Cloeon dipterum TaxID=197152 RepID=UPI0032203199